LVNADQRTGVAETSWKFLRAIDNAVPEQIMATVFAGLATQSPLFSSSRPSIHPHVHTLFLTTALSDESYDLFTYTLPP